MSVLCNINADVATWGQWSEWSQCSESCRPGSRTRSWALPTIFPGLELAALDHFLARTNVWGIPQRLKLVRTCLNVTEVIIWGSSLSSENSWLFYNPFSEDQWFSKERAGDSAWTHVQKICEEFDCWVQCEQKIKLNWKFLFVIISIKNQYSS